jgi:mono/diheme cytochrome c family protein
MRFEQCVSAILRALFTGGGTSMLKSITRVCVIGLLAIGTQGFAQDAAATYKSKCQMCHAADGSASTPAGKSTKARPFNSPDVMKMSDDDLIKVTTDGHDKMPAFKGKLTDAQIKDLVAYIHTLQK